MYVTKFLNKTRQFWWPTKRPLLCPPEGRSPPVEKHWTIKDH